MGYLEDMRQDQVDRIISDRIERDRRSTKFAVHTTFVTGSIVRTEVLAYDRDAAIAHQVAQLPAGTVESVAAWPINGERTSINLGGHRSPAFDSSFGCLV